MTTKQLTPKQLTKIHHARKLAINLMAGKDEAFEKIIESKRKTEVRRLAEVFLEHADSKDKVAVVLILLSWLNSKYKALLAKPPKKTKPAKTLDP